MKQAIYVLMTLSFLLTVTYCGEDKSKASERAVLLTFAAGNVTVQRAGKDENARVGMPLYSQDTVVTEAGAKADIQLSEGAAVRIEENTTVKIEKLKVLENGNTDDNLNLKAGSIYSKIAKMPAGSGYTVKTPTVTAGVRGTEFLTSTSADGETEVAVTAGKVEVGSGDGKQTVLNENEKVAVSTSGDFSKTEMSDSEKSRVQSKGSGITTIAAEKWSAIKSKLTDKETLKNKAAEIPGLNKQLEKFGISPSGSGGSEDGSGDSVEETGKKAKEEIESNMNNSKEKAEAEAQKAKEEAEARKQAEEERLKKEQERLKKEAEEKANKLKNLKSPF